MQKIIITFLALSLFLCGYSQSGEEQTIRRLENDMKEAFLKRDTNILYKILSPKFVVNSPFNRVSTFEDLQKNFRTSGPGADTLSFEKSFEKITFINNLAIVMGQETRKASGEAVNAGKTFQRRFTDVWMKEKDTWLLTIRQSTIFLTE